MSTVTNLQFRRATTSDAKQIQQLIQSAFRAEDSRPEWTADVELGVRFRIEVDTILATINHPDQMILVATNNSNGDDHLVASVTIAMRSADYARLSLLAVDQNYQQGGIGRRVLAYAEDYSRRQWGVTKMGLNALSSRQKLIAWYTRCCYRRTGEVAPFPRRSLVSWIYQMSCVLWSWRRTCLFLLECVSEPTTFLGARVLE